VDILEIKVKIAHFAEFLRVNMNTVIYVVSNFNFSKLFKILSRPVFGLFFCPEQLVLSCKQLVIQGTEKWVCC